MSATASFWIGVVALVVALASASYTRRQTLISAAKSLRDRTPRFSITLSEPAPAPVDRVIYLVHLDGPEDLSSVAVRKPHTTDRISYPVTPTGGGLSWQDAAGLGGMRVGDTQRFTLCCGAAESLPVFEVRIDCVGGRRQRDRWTVLATLPNPRGD